MLYSGLVLLAAGVLAGIFDVAGMSSGAVQVSGLLVAVGTGQVIAHVITKTRSAPVL